MKISIRHGDLRFAKPVEAAMERHILKLEKLLTHYAPDLIQLHGAVEKHPHRVEYTFSLNLSLPTGTLCATAPASRLETCTRKAFAELEGQIKRHQSRLRGDYEWKRKRGRAERALA